MVCPGNMCVDTLHKGENDNNNNNNNDDDDDDDDDDGNNNNNNNNNNLLNVAIEWLEFFYSYSECRKFGCQPGGVVPCHHDD